MNKNNFKCKMKIFNSYCIGMVFVLLFISSCKKEDDRVKYPHSTPEMSNIEITPADNFIANDSIYISLKIDGNETPLSTLNIKLYDESDVIVEQSIRTKGNGVNIIKRGVFIPFLANKDKNRTAKLLLTAINVEGDEKTASFDVNIVRPEFLSSIFLHVGNKTIEMIQDVNNPDVYYTEISTEGLDTEFSGKISDEINLEQSKIIWGRGAEENVTEIIDIDGSSFLFNFKDWFIKRISFNVKTFKLDVDGYQKTITIKGIKLVADKGIYKADINFVEGEEVDVTGFNNIENAYNRDFFSFDKETGKLKFLRQSGTWEVYFYPDYNYIWVIRTNDVAPACFWLVGHGFISAPQWDETYNYGGWDLENISRLGYIVPIGNNKYQTTVYLSNTHEWGGFEIEIYSDREWGKDQGMLLQEGSLSGDIDGIGISESNGIKSLDGFVPGYYRLTFDTSEGVKYEKLDIKRLSD